MTSFIDLPTALVYPEGIAAGADGSLWISGFGSASLLRVKSDNTVETFKAPKQDGLTSPVGLAADIERERLWVANFDATTNVSKLLVFDVKTGELLATIEAPGDNGPHFFNEVVIAPDGTVYVSDTLQPRIWTTQSDLSGPLTVLAEDPLLANPDPARAFGLNGLARTADGKFLIASVMDRLSQGGGRLVRIDIATGNVTSIELTGDVAVFGGSDGMFFEPESGRLVMVNVTPPAAIITAVFAVDFSTATLPIHSFGDGVVNRPSSAVLRGDRLWVVNSQLDHIVDDNNGAFGTDPDMPFQVVGLDAAATLGL